MPDLYRGRFERFVDDKESLCLARKRVSPFSISFRAARLTMDYVNGHFESDADLFSSITIRDVDSTVCLSDNVHVISLISSLFILCVR